MLNVYSLITLAIQLSFISILKDFHHDLIQFTTRHDKLLFRNCPSFLNFGRGKILGDKGISR